jgi:hypothetical protein
MTKSHIFGFRIDPTEKLYQLEKQIFNLWRIYHDKPIFGVELEEEDVGIIYIISIVGQYIRKI